MSAAEETVAAVREELAEWCGPDRCTDVRNLISRIDAILDGKKEG
jgi:hypothetical protein